MGKIYITEDIEITDGSGEYALPHILLDGKGMLLAQLIIYSDDDFIIKSAVEEYPVYSSLDGEAAPEASDSSLKSLALIFSEIENKSDISHIHDDRYYTEAEIAAFTKEIKALIENHNHDGKYFSVDEIEAEIRELFSENPELLVSHNHDNRYYTEAEIEALSEEIKALITASVENHNHSGEYLTEDEVDGKIREILLNSAELSSSHNHDDRYFTENEINKLFEDTEALIEGHNHDGSYAPLEGFIDLLNDVSINREFLDSTTEDVESLLSLSDATEDFVTATGKIGSWNYRKWNSGLAEAWGVASISASKAAYDWGGGIYCVSGYGQLPSGVFVSVDTITAMPIHWYEISASGRVTAGLTIEANIFGKTETFTSTAKGDSVDFNCRISGRWKK